MPISAPELLKKLKKNEFETQYLLYGDEPFYIDSLAEYIEKNALPVQDQSFNQFVFWGKDLSVPALIAHVRRYPMMADRQLIMVKDAENIQDIDKKDMQKILEEYLKNPMPSTILVLVFKENIKENLSWFKAFDSNGIAASSKKMYENKIPDWIVTYCHEKNVKISPKASQMLVEYVGSDLTRISHEIDKIILNLKANEELNAEAVEKYVGISKEYNAFELQKALSTKDVLKANKIINYFASNPKDNPLPQLIILLYNYFSKVLLLHATSDKSERNLAMVLGVNPYFVKDYNLTARNYSLNKVCQIIHQIGVADRRSKGIEGINNDSDTLRELVFMILH
ncbi:MAG: DNA polymerase III subunit delta [Pseudarcicella sp.]|nr:DNA polymerase III subunit delta [Pseudarcicella sp.]MBP6410079.1 DNA polymerase III subunit delta [Pseudarcicella sp.]